MKALWQSPKYTFSFYQESDKNPEIFGIFHIKLKVVYTFLKILNHVKEFKD
ncbi:hypothetical protein MTBBW1_600032 [Desulfamplus magnetovallimortis]|uniref:Uncharacterized protein n=1 Tax=Desulfamplus magnetovallimortis TaxID=1246637 RepID=A0A1W1HII8_9BACT|nr:hypothetical protein MTBBW1_600032 [Desulfamplus magnetovallimortis]